LVVALRDGGFSALVGHASGASPASEDLHLSDLPRLAVGDESQHPAVSGGRPSASPPCAHGVRGEATEGRHVVDQSGVGTDLPTTRTCKALVVVPTVRLTPAGAGQCQLAARSVTFNSARGSVSGKGLTNASLLIDECSGSGRRVDTGSRLLVRHDRRPPPRNHCATSGGGVDQAAGTDLEIWQDRHGHRVSH
jgi:hypothetical protein